MRKFIVAELPDDCRNYFAMTIFKDYVIDEDELQDRLDRIMSNPIACAGAVEILTAPTPDKEKDEWDEWIETFPFGLNIPKGETEIRNWLRKMQRRDK